MISVIMSAYNAEKTVRRAAESILCGSYQDLELIIADDGSSDKTYKILQQISATDPRCICFQNKTNKGLAFSLNKCLDFAHGEFIARMDADDYSLPDRLQVQSDYLTRHKEVGFVGSAAYLIHNNTIYGIRRFPSSPSSSDIIRRNPFIHPSILFRRECFKKTDGYKDTPFTWRCEDYDLFFHLYSKGIKGHNLPQPLLLYEESPHDTSKHTIRSRINEFCVRFCGSLKLKKTLGLLFAFKSLIAVFIPKKLYLKLKYNRKENRFI